LSVAFTADLKGLESGIEEVVDLFDDLSESASELAEKLEGVADRKIKVTATADTSEVAKAAKDVETLSETAKKNKVKIEADSEDTEKKLSGIKDVLKTFGESAKDAAGSLSDWGESLRNASAKAAGGLGEWGKSLDSAVKKNEIFLARGSATASLLSNTKGVLSGTAGAFTATGNAIKSVEGVLSGAGDSIEGIVVAAGRANSAYAAFSATVATGRVIIETIGGTAAVTAAFGGSAAAAAKVVGSLGASLVSAATGVGVFAAIMATTRALTAGMSEEARGYIQTFVAMGASLISAAAAAQAGAVSFSLISNAIWSSSSAGEVLTKIFSAAGKGVADASASMLINLTRVLAVFNLARVASGEFSKALEGIGAKAESIRNMADRFGATTGEMEILTFAADAASVSMSQLAKATQTFFTNISKVKIGQLNVDSVQEAKFAFDRLGVSIDELRNKNPQEVFGLVSDKLLAVKDPADRAAIAFDLFGKQAVNILPALKGLKEAAADAGRLGTVTKDIDFKMFEGVDASFDRLKQASGNLAATMLVAFAPLQTGINNFLADFKGGLVAALGPVRTLMAQATVPIQVFLEVTGRVLNILLRVIGVIGTFAAALANATAIAPAWTALGTIIKDALAEIEKSVDYVQQIASAFSSELNPVIEESASLFDRLVFIVKTFATVVVSAGVASAVMQSFGIQAGAALAKFAAGLSGLNFATIFGGIIKLVRMLTIDVVAMSSKWVASMIVAGTSTLAQLLTPFMTSVAMVITGNSAIAVSATATGYAMAAAWIIGTLGLAAVAVAIIALIQNFDKLYAYFSNFGDNIGKLFTLDGLAEVGTAIADAIFGAFKTVAETVTGFFGGIIGGIIKSISGIKTPEKINAATASVGDVVQSRRGQETAKFQAEAAVAGFTGKTPEMPTEDYDALARSVGVARENMIGLSLNASRFGEAGRKSFLAAKADFDKLQQQLADGTLELKVIVNEDGTKRTETAVEAFERRTREIRGRLQENLNLADVISPEQFQQSAEEMRKSVEEAFAQTRSLMRGSDIGSDLNTDRFFPTSDEVKQSAEKFAMAYQDELIRIEEALQRGDFGQGQKALRAAAQAREQAKANLDRNNKKIEADVSFANDIRKALEDAFLSPVQKYEKKLKEIANNKSLTPQEKSLATIAEQKQMVESTFGKSAGDSLRDKEGMFANATAVDQYGRTAFMSSEGSRAAGEVRASTERTKLDIERRKAAGLDASPAQQLKAGVDNINDVFGVAGKSLTEIQKELGPEKFAEYQEAIKKNSEAVKANLGVEKSGAQKLAESRAKLEKAFNDKVISEQEMNKAVKEQKDALLSSLGISKTPAQDFEDAIAKIKENAAELTPEELQKGLKEAKDKLLQSLGIDKSPAQAAEESLKKLDEAFNKGQISAEEFAKGSQKAKDSLLQSLGIPLDPVTQLGERLGDLREAFDKGLISQEEFTRGQDEARRAMLPGGEAESPVKKFERDLDAVNRAVEEGLITDEDGTQRKKVLQAQLQEDLKPALDKVAPDRRAIESSDVRSKAGVDTFFRILRGNDNPGLKAQLEVARNTRILAEAAAQPEAAEVIAQLSAR
jgi:hypothetical protein